MKIKFSKDGSKKRPIDQIRDGGGFIDYNTQDDNSEITGFVDVNGVQLTVKRLGVYETKFADDIDPERTNINTPNTIQRILPFGSDEPFVGRTLLTANGLLSKNHLQEEIDCKMAMIHILEITKNISEMNVIMNNFFNDQNEAINKIDNEKRNDRSFLLPSLGYVDIKCREFIQKSDHILQKLFKIVRLFYSDVRSGGWTNLKKKIENEEEKVDNFGEFLSQSLPFLNLVRNIRNAAEHPRDEMKIVTKDFQINNNNQLFPPTIQCIHPKTPYATTLVIEFMNMVLKNIPEIVELMVVFCLLVLL